ncbi:MAG: endonuclease/exonuclease/phosphatase family protein [Bacteroidales bacterium]|nr:endonuclease/exonuclease/phosphatase family protein [Bacteroidales bacterium]
MMRRFSVIVLAIMASLICVLPSCSTSEGVKAVSFNIRLSPNDSFDGGNNWNYRQDAVIKFIETEQPDVFGVQEAIYHQAKYMEENLPGYTKYGVDRDGGLEKGEAESNAVFFRNDKYKLLDKGTFWLSATPDVPSRGWDAACHRVVTWVKLKEKGLFGREFYFFNTHFDHVGQVARRESARLVASKIEEIVGEETPVILTGDFNTNVEDLAMAPIVLSMKDARKVSPVTDNEGTFNNWGKNEKVTIIDHIFYKNLTPVSFRTAKENYGAPYISDHYPVVFVGE